MSNSSFTLPEKFKDYVEVKRLPGALWLARKCDSPDGQSSIVLKKCIDPFQSADRAKKLLRQLNLLRTIKHENIVRLIGTYAVKEEDGTESIYAITDYYGEPMSERIERGDHTMDHVKKWTREMLSAVQCLHSNGIIHRDLRPGHFCIDANDKLTLIGFGKDRLINRTQDMHSTRGMNEYSAIELIVKMDGDYDEKVDIWSISALLFDLITGTPLFSEGKNPLRQQLMVLGQIEECVIAKIKNPDDRASINEIVAASEDNRRTDFIDLIRERLESMPKRGIKDEDIVENAGYLCDFIDKTLQFDPERRMSTTRALAHPFLLAPRSWENKMLGNEDQAITALRSHIDEEIRLANVPE